MDKQSQYSMTLSPNRELEQLLLGDEVNWEETIVTERPIVDGETAEEAFALGGNLNQRMKGATFTFEEASLLAQKHNVALEMELHSRGVATTKNIIVPLGANSDFWEDLVSTGNPPVGWRIEERCIRLHYD